MSADKVYWSFFTPFSTFHHRPHDRILLTVLGSVPSCSVLLIVDIEQVSTALFPPNHIVPIWSAIGSRGHRDVEGQCIIVDLIVDLAEIRACMRMLQSFQSLRDLCQ